jgi:hypothetical protein
MFFIGGAAIGITVFANQLGIDHNSQWGRGRVMGLTAGILVIISTIIVFRFFAEISGWLHHNFTRNKLGRLSSYFAGQRPRLIYLSTGLIGISISIIYLWIISAGTWTNWPKTNDYRGYYDQLGAAFDRGQLYIQTSPDPAVLSLPNPYDYFERKKIAYDEARTWDLSLYNGKLYLYWGPVPAVIIALIKPFWSVEISDQYLVFAFILGLFVFQTLLVLRIWFRFFNHMPAWTVLMVIFLGGLVDPIPRMLGQPRIYEAAIVCGQFFLVGGIYFAYSALDHPAAPKLNLVLCGFFWICAVGSRAFLLVPILFLVFMVIIELARRDLPQKMNLRAMSAIIALCLPLTVGGLALGWYNWARFGSVFEFGFGYQLTGRDLNRFRNETFSFAYVPANLYVYLFNPPEIADRFPFIKPGRVGEDSSLYEYLPEHYHTEHVIGPIYATPFMVFSIVGIWIMASYRRQKLLSEEHPGQGMDFQRWFAWTLLGSIPFAALSLLLFFYAAQRYLEDIIPSLFLMSSFGFWQGYYLLGRSLLQRTFYSVSAIGLIGTSAIIGILLSFSGDVLRMRSANPGLLSHLILFFMKISRGIGG